MATSRLGHQLARILGRAARDGAREWLRSRGTRPSPTGTTGREAGSRGSAGASRSAGSPRSDGSAATTEVPGAYPGDYEGVPSMAWAPAADGDPDPGEVVWTWVPFEEDHGRGKDRPVLIVGHDGPWLLGLMLTSQDHDRDAAQEARWGRHWVDIGSGPWDRQGRPSEARVDRVLRVDPTRIRREGAALSRERFEEVAAAVRAAH